MLQPQGEFEELIKQLYGDPRLRASALFDNHVAPRISGTAPAAAPIAASAAAVAAVAGPSSAAPLDRMTALQMRMAPAGSSQQQVGLDKG